VKRAEVCVRTLYSRKISRFLGAAEDITTVTLLQRCLSLGGIFVLGGLHNNLVSPFV
jgi:hypothetical protein